MTAASIGKILEEHTEGNNRLGLIEFATETADKRRTIYLNLVPGARVGDYVRFRAGFATESVSGPLAAPAGSGKPETAAEEDKEPSLETYRLLSELDPGQLRKLIVFAQDKVFEAGDILFHADDKSRFLFLIVAGEVSLDDVAGGKSVHIQTLAAGDATGWSALTSGARTHFQARAVTRVSSLAFSGDEIGKAFDQDPAMGYAFMKRLLELVTERLDVVRLKLAGLESHT